MSYAEPSSLPPTHNSLSRLHRHRSLRTTRKVGVILGTTPRILDTETVQAKDLELTRSPRGSVDGISQPVIPPVSLHLRRSVSTHRQTTLNLQLAPTDTPDSESPLPSPVTTPITPTFVVPPVERRKKMLAKLARTLGENIPVELVQETPSSSGRIGRAEISPSTLNKTRSASESKSMRHRRRDTYHQQPAPFEASSTSGWEGDWNIQDVDRLRSKLRALK